MATHWIVERVDVVRHVGVRAYPGFVDLLLDALFLQAAKEGLRDGIVPAVALSTHARFQTIRSAEAPPGIAAVLRPLIGMNQSAAWPPAARGEQHGVDHQLAVNRRSSCPPHNFAGEEVDDDGQVEPSLPGPDIRDVRDPRLVAARRRELALEMIRNQDRRLADRPPTGTIAMQRSEAVLAHQPRHTMLAAGFASLS